MSVAVPGVKVMLVSVWLTVTLTVLVVDKPSASVRVTWKL